MSKKGAKKRFEVHDEEMQANEFGAVLDPTEIRPGPEDMKAAAELVLGADEDENTHSSCQKVVNKRFFCSCGDEEKQASTNELGAASPESTNVWTRFQMDEEKPKMTNDGDSFAQYAPTPNVYASVKQSKTKHHRHHHHEHHHPSEEKRYHDASDDDDVKMKSAVARRPPKEDFGLAELAPPYNPRRESVGDEKSFEKTAKQSARAGVARIPPPLLKQKEIGRPTRTLEDEKMAASTSARMFALKVVEIDPFLDYITLTAPSKSSVENKVVNLADVESKRPALIETNKANEKGTSEQRVDYVAAFFVHPPPPPPPQTMCVRSPPIWIVAFRMSLRTQTANIRCDPWSLARLKVKRVPTI